MPNQYNFRTDLTTQTEPRFIASRIISVPEEGVLLEQLPASFGFDNFDNIEIHFYTATTDALIFSTTVDASDVDILKSHVVSYEDGTYKNYIRIDFTALFEKKNLLLIPGEYKAVFNFFSDEIGGYNNKNMYVQDVSESRTEVQLAFYAARDIEERIKNQNELREFALPAFAKPDAIGVAEKIFRSGVKLDDPSEGLLYPNIVDNIEIPLINQTLNNTITRLQRLDKSVEDNLVENLHEFLLDLYQNIREEIVINGDNRTQEDEFIEFINAAVEEKFKNYDWSVDNRFIVS
jgi:hypothetical protein